MAVNWLDRQTTHFFYQILRRVARENYILYPRHETDMC